MRIEVICTGDEVLSGKTTNTNFSYIARRLEDAGLAVARETTVGDDRVNLLDAFRLAAGRADAVIVNGGLGPTVDDLSQEVAAEAAGVKLIPHVPWLARLEQFFRERGRPMTPSNRKQALLPEGAELLDNPIGTACGFAVTIDRARFFFTPGVPRELRRMLEEQVIPRLTQQAGAPGVIRLKRFHTYGLGESQVDQRLSGIEVLDPEGTVKLGFRAHYPQIEAKLTARGASAAEVAARLAPMEAEVRRRLGGFIVAEDDRTLEGVVLDRLGALATSLSLVETYTAGQIAGRIVHLAGAELVFRRGIVARDPLQIAEAIGVDPWDGPASEAIVAAAACAVRRATGAGVGLAVLVDLDETQAEGNAFAAIVWVALISDLGQGVRRARIAGGRDWVRLGAVELGLDCLRRHLFGLPLDEPVVGV